VPPPLGPLPLRMNEGIVEAYFVSSSSTFGPAPNSAFRWKLTSLHLSDVSLHGLLDRFGDCGVTLSVRGMKSEKRPNISWTTCT